MTKQSGRQVASDAELAAAATRGSESAFDELVTRYQDRLLRFLLVRCNSRADAEDAIQDTFVSAWKYLHSYDSRWRFSTWLYRIALRNAAREPLVPATDSAELATTDDPLSACIERSERENLWLTARSTLGHDAYSAMWLRYAEDMPLQDVATVLDRSLAWTKVSLMRSRQRLKRAMQAEDVTGHRSEMYDKS